MREISVPLDLEQDLIDLIQTEHTEKTKCKDLSKRITVKKVTDMYTTLSQAGFTQSQIETCMNNTVEYGGDLIDALDWFCLNLPNEKLPSGFSTALGKEEEKIRPKFDIQLQQNITLPAPSTQLTEIKAKETEKKAPEKPCLSPEERYFLLIGRDVDPTMLFHPGMALDLQRKKTYSLPASSSKQSDDKDTGPKISVPLDLEQDLIDLIQTEHTEKTKCKDLSKRITVKKVTDMYTTLSHAGFTQSQIETCMNNTVEYGGDLIDALDWFCLNLPNEKLPSGFSTALMKKRRRRSDQSLTSSSSKILPCQLSQRKEEKRRSDSETRELLPALSTQRRKKKIRLRDQRATPMIIETKCCAPDMHASDNESSSAAPKGQK